MSQNTISVPDAARLVGVTQSAIRQAIDRGRLEVDRDKLNRYQIDAKSLRGYVADRAAGISRSVVTA